MYIRRVAWGETDAAGIVFYPNYFRWFDEAAHSFFRELGYPVQRMLSEGFAFPLKEAGARFVRPLDYDDELTVETRVTEVRSRAVRLEHTVSRRQDPVCQGFEVRVCATVPTLPGQLALIPIPERVRRLLDDSYSPSGK